jgi:hypothetical protein
MLILLHTQHYNKLLPQKADEAASKDDKPKDISAMIAAEVADLKDKSKRTFKYHDTQVQGTVYIQFPEEPGGRLGSCCQSTAPVAACLWFDQRAAQWACATSNSCTGTRPRRLWLAAHQPSMPHRTFTSYDLPTLATCVLHWQPGATHSGSALHCKP